MHEKSSIRSRMPRAAVVVVVTVVMSLLTACTTIPSSGPVRAGHGVASEANPDVDFLARSPQPGATQEEILLGFVAAAASPHDSYAVAREYLTAEFSATWRPDSIAMIDADTQRTPSLINENFMTLTVSALADVGESGDYVQREAPSTQVLGYEFVSVDGQWRISKAPPGILVDQPTFALVFGSYPLYFFDPSFSYLVPDLRWFPRRTSTPTSIVKALLAGPSEWLSGAVRSAFPEGAKLVPDSVQVMARQAQVDLTPNVLQTEAVALQRMRLQLKESLDSVSAISGVTITVDQIEQQIPDLLSPPTADPHVDPRALILRDKEFGYLAASGSAIAAIDISEAIVALEPKAVSLGLRQGAGNTAAVLSAAGVSVVRAGSDTRLLDERAKLIAPIVDNFGFVWSVPSDAPGSLIAYAPDGSAIPVSTNWPDATSITSLALSRDGTRLVALYNDGVASRLVVTAVLRGDGDLRNAPQELGPPLELAVNEGRPLGTTWVNELTIVTLSGQSNGETALVSQQIGGPSQNIEGAAGAIALSGGNAARELRLLTNDGMLLQRRGLSWQSRIDEVSVLGVPLGL